MNIYLKIISKSIRLGKAFICHPILFIMYLKDIKKFLKQSQMSLHKKIVFFKTITPYLQDRTTVLKVEPHYTYHLAWAARRIKEVNPVKHLDISSQQFFAVLVSSFIPFEYYEYRPAELYLPGLKSGAADLLSLPFEDNSIQSLSCMHVVEHLGLGRYGDAIDPTADKKAVRELIRCLAWGGDLFFVVPVAGEETKIEFNGQRIYSYADVMQMFQGIDLIEFSLIPDDYQEHCGMIINADASMVSSQKYGCGCFWFRKRGAQK